MSTTTKKATAQGVRYSDAQKKEVVDFAVSHNATNGRGGQSEAAKKFKISPITVAAWLKGAGAVAPKASKAPKAAKVAKAPKAPKAAKKTKAPKAPKAEKTQAPKAAKSAGKSNVGTRYTDAEKKEVVDFVLAYNAANGRGGQSKAAKKFKISPLTVMAWLKVAGVKKSPKKAVTKGVRYVSPGKLRKFSKTAKSNRRSISSVSNDLDAKLNSLLALSKEIAKAEVELAQLNAKFKTLKASI